MNQMAVRQLNLWIAAALAAAKATRPEWRAAWFRDCDDAIARYDAIVAEDRGITPVADLADEWTLPTLKMPSRQSRWGLLERITGLPFGEVLP